jgi:hypothetical protein
VKRFALVVSVIAALVGAQAAAGAPSRVDVSGTYAITDLGAVACTNASPFVARCTATGAISQYSGTLAGESASDFRQIINCKKGRTHGHGTETFTGSLEGVGSGTLTWGIHFRSTFDCTTFAMADFVGRGVLTSGTGDLAGLNGSIQFGETTYEGVLH